LLLDLKYYDAPPRPQFIRCRVILLLAVLLRVLVDAAFSRSRSLEHTHGKKTNPPENPKTSLRFVSSLSCTLAFVFLFVLFWFFFSLPLLEFLLLVSSLCNLVLDFFCFSFSPGTCYCACVRLWFFFLSFFPCITACLEGVSFSSLASYVFFPLWVMLRCSLSCLCLGISWGRIIFAFFPWTWLPYILLVCIGVHDCRASYPYVAVVFLLLTDWFFFPSTWLFADVSHLGRGL
jgi:hypothetical protein